MIVIVNYGMGNLRSIQYKLLKCGINVKISSEADDIEQAEKIILPGVGAFAAGMENLKRLDLIPILNHKVLGCKTPIMGICLGMQLFTKWSEEGNAEGLGWIDAITKKIKNNQGNTLRVPHVGWNTIKIKKKIPLVNEVTPNQHFYFTHSYYVSCKNPSDIVATTDYGLEFTSAIQHENIFGTQFHPEKSHRKGLDIILKFIKSA